MSELENKDSGQEEQQIVKAIGFGHRLAAFLLDAVIVGFFSLVLGVGLAWARGTELLREPSWWPGSEQTALTVSSPAADAVPAVAPGAAVQPSAAGPGAVVE